MGDGWMIRGTDAEKEERIPVLMGMSMLPAPGSLALRSLCPHCYLPLLWSPATDGIPRLRNTLGPPSHPIQIVLYRLYTRLYFQLLLGLKALVYLDYVSLLHTVPFPQTGEGELESCGTPALANSQPCLLARRVQKSSRAAGCSQTLPQGSGAAPASYPPTESRASSCALLLFSLQARNVSPGRHGGSFLLLFSSIASSNDNSTIHLLVKHLK